MEKVNHFLKRLFRLILACHILECNSCLLLHIHLGIAFPDSHHAAAFCHALHEISEQERHQSDRKDQCHEHLQEQLPHRVRSLTSEFHARIFQALRKCIIINITCIIIRIMFGFCVSGLRLHLLFQLSHQAA